MCLPEPKQSSLAEFVQSLTETKLVSLPMRVRVTGHRVLEDKAGDWVGQQLDGLFSNLAASSCCREPIGRTSSCSSTCHGLKPRGRLTKKSATWSRTFSHPTRRLATFAYDGLLDDDSLDNLGLCSPAKVDVAA